MTRRELLEFLRAAPLAVLASLSPDGAPQAAIVAVAVGDRLEMVFDTLDNSRKFANLRADRRIALVFGAAGPYHPGSHDERTLQLEGLADIPAGDELRRLQETVYFQRFPEGRARLAWPHIAYVRIRPAWMRFSDYNASPPHIAEWSGAQLAAFIVES